MSSPVYINPFKPRWEAITPDIVADVYTKQHWPTFFSNLEVHCQPGDALSYQEANVILAVIEEVMSSVLRHDSTRGTFIMDGYKTGNSCECLLRGNLKNGPSVSHILTFDSDRSSDDLAAEAIDDALAYPDEEGSAFARSKHWEKGEYLDNGIHDTGSLQVMALNTTAGHFLVSFYAPFNTTSREDINAMLVAIAEALAQLKPTDEGLQSATKEITERWTNSQTTVVYKKSVRTVREMFRECEHPVIQAWQAWRKANPCTNFFN